MKKVIVPILTGLILGAIGFFIGQNIGYENGKQMTETLQQFRTVDEIKAELKQKEKERISSYLDSKAGIQNVDEGGLWKTKYVQYFSGSLTNSAVLSTAKDVKINVDFYSKTGSKIGNQEITIFEFVRPGKTINFKEKINIPDKVEDFKFQIIEVKAE
ncbi:MAG: hypothetical protein ISS18_01865 [Bacteroidales bacterium]|nr:hypothetical protein [Bacteroidales bacterium]